MPVPLFFSINLDFFSTFAKILNRMMYRKFPAILLFLFSFVLITVGGYQCATRVTTDQEIIPIVGGGTDSYGNNSGQYDGYYSDAGEERPLPPEPGDSCARSQYRDLAERYGEMAVFKFDRTSVEDYRLGASQNFDLKCARLYLSMTQLSSSETYKGLLRISYETGGNIIVDRFDSGSSMKDNKYNHWSSGSWNSDQNNNVDKQFYAIFENTDRAIILKLEDVRVRDIRDGEAEYFGAGEIHYKMFRYSQTAGKNDVCHSRGGYMRGARQQPPRRKKCWLTSTGPFSCLPNGVLSVQGGSAPAVPMIDITGDLNCYNRLGVFFNLEIEEAFDVGDVEELD